MWSYYYWMLHRLDNLRFDDWVWVGLATLVIGVFCLRGFGSRTNY